MNTSILAIHPVSGALMVWERPSSGNVSERLVLREGSSRSVFLDDPLLRDRLSQLQPAVFRWTPDGTQCAWDGDLYDYEEFLAKGPGGARAICAVPRGDVSWFLEA